MVKAPLLALPDTAASKRRGEKRGGGEKVRGEAKESRERERRTHRHVLSLEPVIMVSPS
jgi:hypothetical protein